MSETQQQTTTKRSSLRRRLPENQPQQPQAPQQQGQPQPPFWPGSAAASAAPAEPLWEYASAGPRPPRPTVSGPAGLVHVQHRPERRQANDVSSAAAREHYFAILFFVVAMFIGSQMMTMMNGAETDTLITSEFVQAVEQDRVQNVVYDAGSYTVTGTYYPAATAGSTASDAYNNAIGALNPKSKACSVPMRPRLTPPTSMRKALAPHASTRLPTWAKIRSCSS